MATQPDLKPLAPLARTIAETVRDTPIRLGTPEGAADLVAQLTVKVAAYMGRELGPDAKILGEIQAERARQDERWGEQNHPDGTGLAGDDYAADLIRQNCQQAEAEGRTTWRHILAEEIAEAYAEKDPALLRTELVQCAAVIQAWLHDLDTRQPTTPAQPAAR